MSRLRGDKGEARFRVIDTDSAGPGKTAGADFGQIGPAFAAHR
jgi:hypothetical protein